MGCEESFNFGEFKEYVAGLSSNCPFESEQLKLPQTASEFQIWWSKICVSDELRERWVRRIRPRDSETHASQAKTSSQEHAA